MTSLSGVSDELSKIGSIGKPGREVSDQGAVISAVPQLMSVTAEFPLIVSYFYYLSYIKYVGAYIDELVKLAYSVFDTKVYYENRPITYGPTVNDTIDNRVPYEKAKLALAYKYGDYQVFINNLKKCTEPIDWLSRVVYDTTYTAPEYRAAIEILIASVPSFVSTHRIGLPSGFKFVVSGTRATLTYNTIQIPLTGFIDIGCKLGEATVTDVDRFTATFDTTPTELTYVKTPMYSYTHTPISLSIDGDDITVLNSLLNSGLPIDVNKPNVSRCIRVLGLKRTVPISTLPQVHVTGNTTEGYTKIQNVCRAHRCPQVINFLLKNGFNISTWMQDAAIVSAVSSNVELLSSRLSTGRLV
jgi:hypothetical protein